MALNTLSLFRLACPGAGNRTIFVSGSGSDANNGLTSATPLRQITAAIAIVQPGDRISVAAGSYLPVSLYSVKGTSNAWITIEGPGNDSATVDATSSPTDGAAGLSVQLGAYIGIYGLEVKAVQTITPVSISGIAVFRGSHHIRIWKNHVHDFPAGGINCFYIQSSVYNGNPLPAGGWDLVDIRFNTIHGTSRYDPNNTSGISIFGAEELTGTTWDGRYGYTLIGNYIYDVLCTQPYTAGGYNFVTDGNGISLDSLNTATVFNSGNAPYVKRGLVEGNLVMGCGGRGLHTYNTINVDDFNNTYIGNLRTNSPAINNGIESDAAYDTVPGSTGVVHSGNVILPLNTPNTTDNNGIWTNNIILGGTQAVPAGNVDKRATGNQYFTTPPTASSIIAGSAITSFVPMTIDSVQRAPGSYGYQVLGNGPRYNIAVATWAAGAIDAQPVLDVLT